MRPFRILVFLLLCPCLMRAAITPQDWVGSYQMNHDGHVGMLSVSLSTAKCAKLPCPGLAVQYRDEHGASYGGIVTALDDEGQHMAFTIEFPGAPQRFDVYLFSFDKTRMAGTTVWGGRVFGVMGTKSNLKLGAIAAQQVKPMGVAGAAATTLAGASTGTPTRVVLPNGTVELHYADGTVKSKRIGSCGWSVRTPDGRVVNPQCIEADVIPIVPPPPPAGSPAAQWLSAESDRLLEVLQGLLGGANSRDFHNYQANYENPPDPALYKRIYFRTLAITELTSVPH
jgi:hypothetical protein